MELELSERVSRVSYTLYTFRLSGFLLIYENLYIVTSIYTDYDKLPLFTLPLVQFASGSLSVAPLFVSIVLRGPILFFFRYVTIVFIPLPLKGLACYFFFTLQPTLTGWGFQLPVRKGLTGCWRSFKYASKLGSRFVEGFYIALNFQFAQGMPQAVLSGVLRIRRSFVIVMRTALILV